MIAIFDIDGVLADNSYTQRLDCTKPAQAAKFAREIETVKPLVSGVVLIKAIAEAGYKVFIMTARSAELRLITENWLDDNLLPRENVFMRPLGNQDTPAALKEKQLHELAARFLPADLSVENIIAFEDDKTVAEMYNRHGIKVFMPL